MSHLTPKEKAHELVGKFQLKINEYPAEIYEDDIEFQTAIQCALIAVDEMLSLGSLVGSDLSDRFFIYWQSVQNELNNL